MAQEGIDALIKKEKEIKQAAFIEGRSIGMNEYQANDYANKSYDLFKNKQMLEVQKKFVDLEAQRQNLETEKKKSTQQNDLMKFIEGIPRDTQNLRDFPNKSQEYAAANHAILYHPVEEIRTIAQNEIKKVNDEYDRFHGGALKEASKYDLTFIPEEALGENGHLDDQRLYKLGMPHYNATQEQRRQQAIADQQAAAQQIGVGMEPSSITTTAEGDPRVTFENPKQKIDAARREFQVRNAETAERAAQELPYPWEKKSTTPSQSQLPQAGKKLTKDVLHSLADELGPNATKESLMDLASKRGYTY